MFTISAGQANTDTTQTFVIPGDTTGTWLTDTGIGMQISVCVATGTTYQGTTGWQAGSINGTSANTNGMSTVANLFTLYDVGLYLDANVTGLAPKWQMPDEAQELAACQRYWRTSPQMTGKYYSATQVSLYGSFAPPMRVDPAVTLSVTTNAITEIGVSLRTITGVIGLSGQAIGDLQCGVNATGTASNMAATAVQKVFVISARM